MFIYIIIGFVFLLALACALAPFFKASMDKDLDKEYDKEIEALSNSHLKRALKYSCPHCGGKLRVSDTKNDCQCRQCNRLYHCEYILFVYEDFDD